MKKVTGIFFNDFHVSQWRDLKSRLRQTSICTTWPSFPLPIINQLTVHYIHKKVSIFTPVSSIRISLYIFLSVHFLFWTTVTLELTFAVNLIVNFSNGATGKRLIFPFKCPSFTASLFVVKGKAIMRCFRTKPNTFYRGI